jgi:hypothetical protein
MNMLSTSQSEKHTENRQLILYIRVTEGTPSYQTFVGEDSSSVTQIDLVAAAQEDSRRFHEAWTELAKA